MTRAVGVHAHLRLKLGRRPPKHAPALMLADVLTGVVPEHPATVDHFGKLEFGLYGNDQYGDCGPVSVANLVRLVTGGLLGSEIQPSQEDVFDLYRRSGNPDFDPKTDAGDEGVDMQTMLEALRSDGIGAGSAGNFKIKPIAFARVDAANDDELEAAVSIFGGVLWGVNLLEAQQAQTEEEPPRWDYRKSGEWGGHAVLHGTYENPSLDDVISWAIRVQTTAGFRLKQLEEAWVVVWPWNIEHPAFQAGVDLEKLRQAYKELTGRELPVPAPVPPAPPEPIPTPTPEGEAVTAADRALWAAVEPWALARHARTNKKAAKTVRAWARAKGLST